MIRDIKPEPVTAYDHWLRWLNHTQTRLIIMGGKKVVVRYEV